MVFFINNKKIRLNPYDMHYDKCIGTGTMASVYLIDRKAYKLYHPFGISESITKEKIDLYKTIPTKRIILPDDVLLDKKRNVRGYVSRYIENLGIENLMQQKKSKILEEFKILREDFILLGEYKVETNDVNVENSIFNQGIYIADCGRFETEKETEYDSTTTIAYNLDDFDQYFLYEIMYRDGVNEEKHREYVNTYKDNLSEEIEILDYLKEDMSQTETFGQYVKRKVM